MDSHKALLLLLLLLTATAGQHHSLSWRKEEKNVVTFNLSMGRHICTVTPRGGEGGVVVVSQCSSRSCMLVPSVGQRLWLYAGNGVFWSVNQQSWLTTLFLLLDLSNPILLCSSIWCCVPLPPGRPGSQIDRYNYKIFKGAIWLRRSRR